MPEAFLPKAKGTRAWCLLEKVSVRVRSSTFSGCIRIGDRTKEAVKLNMGVRPTESRTVGRIKTISMRG